MSKDTFILLSNSCAVLGFVSIIGSIAIWYLKKGVDEAALAHAERFGIFVGLWAPTFFAFAAFLRTLTAAE